MSDLITHAQSLTISLFQNNSEKHMNHLRQTTVKTEMKMYFVMENNLDFSDRRSKAQKAQELKDDIELLEILELEM